MFSKARGGKRGKLRDATLDCTLRKGEIAGDKRVKGGRCTCHNGSITGFRRLEFGGLTKHD